MAGICMGAGGIQDFGPGSSRRGVHGGTQDCDCIGCIGLAADLSISPLRDSGVDTICATGCGFQDFMGVATKGGVNEGCAERCIIRGGAQLLLHGLLGVVVVHDLGVHLIDVNCAGA